jgi:hypothetical protein
MADERQQPGRDEETQPAAGAPNADGSEWEAAPALERRSLRDSSIRSRSGAMLSPLVEFGWRTLRMRPGRERSRNMALVARGNSPCFTCRDPAWRVQKILVTGIISTPSPYCISCPGPAPWFPTDRHPSSQSGWAPPAVGQDVRPEGRLPRRRGRNGTKARRLWQTPRAIRLPQEPSRSAAVPAVSDSSTCAASPNLPCHVQAPPAAVATGTISHCRDFLLLHG